MFLIVKGYNKKDDDAKEQVILDTKTGYTYRLGYDHTTSGSVVTFKAWESHEDHVMNKRHIISATNLDAFSLWFQLFSYIDHISEYTAYLLANFSRYISEIADIELEFLGD